MGQSFSGSRGETSSSTAVFSLPDGTNVATLANKLFLSFNQQTYSILPEINGIFKTFIALNYRNWGH